MSARSARPYLVAIVAGVVFGGADQYLGSRVTLGPWAYSVSGMSAPWLLLPFLFGAGQTAPRRAMAVGVTATMAALAGYFAMTLSPIEGVPLSAFPGDLVGLAHSNARWIVGGVVGGPLYGLLGQRWRVSRSWVAAAAVAAAFCFEPLVRLGAGQLTPAHVVWLVEVTVGVAMAAFFVRARHAHRQRSALDA